MARPKGGLLVWEVFDSRGRLVCLFPGDEGKIKAEQFAKEMTIPGAKPWSTSKSHREIIYYG